MTQEGNGRSVNMVHLSLKCIRVSVEECFYEFVVWFGPHVENAHPRATHANTRCTGCYTVEIPELDFPSGTPSFGSEQDGGGVKLASGRVPSKDGLGDGDGGSRVLFGLLMSPSPTRVRSVCVSSSTVRRLGRMSKGREIGDKWVPKVG